MVRKYSPYTIAKNFKLSYVQHIASDFETCYTDETKSNVRVWEWGFENYITNKYEEGFDISSFLERILKDRFAYDIGFHNLRFDGSYIIPALYKLGYTYINNNEFLKKWEDGESVARLFTHNITTTGEWFSIMIGKEKNVNVSTPAFVHIWDTYKLFSMSLDEIGLRYGTKHKKIKVDPDFYSRIRPVGYIPTQNEREYLRGDVGTLADALRLQYEKYGTVYRTKASKAFALFKEECTDEAGSNNYQKKYEGIQQWATPKIQGLEEYEGEIIRYLPQDVRNKVNASRVKLVDSYENYIPNFFSWLDIKKAYNGAINYLNPLYKGKDINERMTYIDVNSMYGFVQRNCELPYGRFIKQDGAPDFKKGGLWIACAYVSFKLKNSWNLPCIQIREKYGREWLAESTDYKETGDFDYYNEDMIWFTSVDYETYLENYDFIVHDWVCHYYFPNSGIKDGKAFIDKYSKEKQIADRIMHKIKKQKPDTYQEDEDYLKAVLDRQEAKNTMTSAYGKHGTKYFIYCRDSIYQGPDKPIKFEAEKTLNKNPDKDPSKFYIPYAAFITAYSRQILVRAWNTFKGRAVYCDCDSIHFIGTSSSIPEELQSQIDWKENGRLGFWKIQGEYKRGRFVRLKSYIETEENDKEVITCAGAPSQIKELMTWENFKIGFDAWAVADALNLDRTKHSKITSKAFPDGVALEYTNFEIRG